jgi:DNA adenine methylase
MQYLGGKARLAKRICAILESHRAPGQRFVDVFTGGANIVAGMGDHGPRVANDGCEPLIALYQAWLAGWRPPAEVSEELYREVKAKRDPSDPLTAFVGVGCSFGGKWFGGFARRPLKIRNLTPEQVAGIIADDRKQTAIANDYCIDQPSVSLIKRTGGASPYAVDASLSLTKKLIRCADVQFTCQDFRAVEILPGDLVYCDSPYFGTTAYDWFTGFDYPAYVSRLTDWARIADVFVSEYAAQAANWELVTEFPRKIGTLSGGKTERLYRVRPS